MRIFLYFFSLLLIHSSHASEAIKCPPPQLVKSSSTLIRGSRLYYKDGWRLFSSSFTYSGVQWNTRFWVVLPEAKNELSAILYGQRYFNKKTRMNEPFIVSYTESGVKCAYRDEATEDYAIYTNTPPHPDW